MSGSGPTVFGLFDDPEHARAAAAQLPAARLAVGAAAMKWGWLLGAVALAGFLIARHKRLERWLQIAGWIAVAAAAAIGIGLVPLPNLEELLEDVGQALGPWTYLLVGVLAFLETGAFVGFIAPGETAVIVGGVVAGQGEISLLVLIGIVWACAVAGDIDVVHARPPARAAAGCCATASALKITEERLKQVEGFFERRGGADDPGRPLHRLRPPARAVPRRRVADAAAALPALRRARRRRSGRRRSRRSATSSGTRSTSSRRTSRAGCSRSGPWSP